MLVGWSEVRAQDPQFTQFYAAPLYHNPAFAGGAFRGRIVSNYRNQWPSIPGNFVTYSVSYDNYYSRYNSGLGFIVTTDRAGSADLRSTTVATAYSYQLELSRNWVARMGVQFGGGFRSLDYTKLVFGDQLEQIIVDGNTNPVTQDPDRNDFNNNIGYFDVASGFLLYSRLFWFGAATHHMNEPNHSFTEGNSLLPMRVNFMTGMNIPLTRRHLRRRVSGAPPEKYLVPAMLYKFQGEFDQFDVGCYLHYNPIMIGLWYRGLPIKPYTRGLRNHDAVAILLGLRQDNFSFGYSYDLTVSRLGPGTGGAHEISLAYEFDGKRKKKKKPKLIPCPKF